MPKCGSPNSLVVNTASFGSERPAAVCRITPARTYSGSWRWTSKLYITASSRIARLLGTS